VPDDKLTCPKSIRRAGWGRSRTGLP